MRAISLDNGMMVSAAKAGRAAASRFDARLLRGTDVLALEADWRMLESSGDGVLPFNRFDFASAWIDRFAMEGVSNAPAAITVRDNGQLVALLPLALRRVGPLTIAEWLGEPVTEYGDALVARGRSRQAWLDAALETLLSSGIDMAMLRKVRADAMIAPALERIAKPAGECRAAPFIDLIDHTDIAALRSVVRPKLRREIRRQTNKLASHGELTFDVFEPGPQAREAVAHALDFKRAWLEERGDISRAFADTRLDQFLSELATARNAGNGLLVSQLKAGETVAAVEIGFRAGTRYYAYMGTYNADFHRASPGTVQMDKTLEWCIANGIEAYDLFAPSDDYKMRWTDASVPVRDYAVSSSAAGKALHLWINTIRPALKAVFLRLPGWLKRPLARLLRAR